MATQLLTANNISVYGFPLSTLDFELLNVFFIDDILFFLFDSDLWIVECGKGRLMFKGLERICKQIVGTLEI
jgi:hypothetical protein